MVNNRLVHLSLFVLSVAALFFIFTSGVPLIQWGWVESWGLSKKPYVRATRYALIVFAAGLGICYFFARSLFDNLWIVKAAKRLKKLPLAPMLAIWFILYVAILTSVGFMRHAALETRSFDLGIFVQAVWNTTQGDFLYSSIKGGICLLGDHMSPILAVLAPIYGVWEDPRLLLFIQAFAAGTGVFLIAWIAMDKLKSHGAALIFSALYLAYFPTRAALHEDFHPEVLVEPFILLAFIFLERKRIIPLLLCLLVVVSGKENMLGISFIMGFYALVFKKMRVLGSVLMLVSAAVFWLDVSWLIPKISGEKYLYQGSYQAILTGQGGKFFAHLFGTDSWEYLAKVFLPFLFLPFFHLPTLILTFPIFFQNVISENEVMRSFNYHYTTGMTPFVFISAIYGYSVLITKYELLGKFRKELLFIILFAGLVKSGASEYYYFWQSHENATPHVQAIRGEMAKIPQAASVLTHNNFIPQVINRKQVHQFDYTTVVSKAEMAQKHDVDYVIMDGSFWETNTEAIGPTLAKLEDAGYRTQVRKDSFFVMKKSRN